MDADTVITIVLLGVVVGGVGLVALILARFSAPPSAMRDAGT